MMRRIVESSVSIESTGCAAILSSTYTSTDTLVAAHIRQTSLKQDAPERPPEVLVEDRIDDGIERRIHVSQPKGRGERDAGNVVGQSQYIHEKERQPAGDERAHDQSQNQRCSFLFFPRDPTLLSFRIAGFLNSRHL